MLDYACSRSTVTLILAHLLVKSKGLNPFADVPGHCWKPLITRSIVGTIAFGTTSIGLMVLPLSIFNILFNCAPFFTAILAWCYLKETISYVQNIAMFGSFIGVIFIALGMPKEGD